MAQTLATPSGGWKFSIGRVTMIAEDFDGLLRNVRSHKLANGIEIGDLDKEVKDQIELSVPGYKFPEFKCEVKK